MEQGWRRTIDRRAIRTRPRFEYANLREVIASIEPRLDGTFFDGRCLQRIRAIAEQFPANASEFFGFERTLGCEDARADLAIGISERGAAWLRSEGPWAAVADVLARCFEHVAVGKIRPWLEFDTSLATRAQAQPSMYIGIDPRRNAVAATLALARSIARSPDISFEAVARCLALLPAGASCLYIGTMLGRNAIELRLSFASLGLDELVSYLDRAGWPGDRSAVEALLLLFRSACTRYGIQLDVSSGVQPTLGIEMLVDAGSLTERANEEIVRLLRLLVEQQMCSPAECAALAHWPHTIASASPLLDRYIAAAQPGEGGSFRGSLVSALHHVKFTFTPDRRVRTKAYFGVFLDSR